MFYIGVMRENMHFKVRYWLFWDVTESRLAVPCRRFGQPIGPLFSGLLELLDVIYTGAGPLTTRVEMNLANYVAGMVA
jgi:hypothetical protein